MSYNSCKKGDAQCVFKWQFKRLVRLKESDMIATQYASERIP